MGFGGGGRGGGGGGRAKLSIGLGHEGQNVARDSGASILLYYNVSEVMWGGGGPDAVEGGRKTALGLCSPLFTSGTMC